MRTASPLALVVGLLVASSTSPATPVNFVVEPGSAPGSCVLPAAMPCAVGYHTGESGAPSDDTLYISPVVQRAELTAPEFPLLGDVDAGFDRGEVTAPVPIRSMLLTAFQETDDGVGDWFSHEELGPMTIWVTIRPPAPGGVEVSVPVPAPVIEKDGLRAKTVSNKYDSDTALYYAAAFGDRCFFQDNLPDTKDRLCASIDGTPAAESLTRFIPAVQLGYRVEEVFLRATGSSGTSIIADGERSAGERAEADAGPLRVNADSHLRHTAEEASGGRTGASIPRMADLAREGPAQMLGEAAARSEDVVSGLVLAALAFLPLPLWRLYRRMKTRACLDHDFRTAILREVRHQPGVQPAELARRLACSFKTVTHHLAVLRSFGHVDLERRGNALHVFERGVHPQVVKGLYVSRQPTRLRVLRLVAARPGIGCSAIARELGMSKPGVHSHLKALERDRVLLRRGRRGWEVAPEAQQAWHVVAEVAQSAPQPPAAGPIS